MKTKKLFFIAMSLYFICNASLAQIGKGINVLSGSILYSATNGESPESSSSSNHSSLSAIPRYGHFFWEKAEAGISIGYTWSDSKEETSGNYYSSGKTESGLFLVGPYVRLYQNLAERFYFSFSATATFYTGSTKQTTSTSVGTDHTEYEVSRFQAGISPGLTYFFNNHWATNISVGVLNYDSSKTTDTSSDETSTSNTFTGGINAGGLGFGIGFYF
jgi:hypothetical protein